MLPHRCAERQCIRLPWEDGLCWWCSQARAAKRSRKCRLDSAAPRKAPLGPEMTHEDTREG